MNSSAQRTIPRMWLVVPPLIPLLLAGGVQLYFALGNGVVGHSSGNFLFVLIWISAMVAIVLECVLVPLSIFRLLKDSVIRTWGNIGSVLFGATLASIFAGTALWFG